MAGSPVSDPAARTPPQVRPALPADAAGLQDLFARSLLGAAWMPPGVVPDTDFAQNSQGEVSGSAPSPAAPCWA